MREKIPVVRGIMTVDTSAQAIDMQEIQNRRFMFNPKTKTLVLGHQYGKTKGLPGSHAEELAKAGITQGFDDFTRGWVGTGRDYPHGVIHFAPSVDARHPVLFDRAFDTLEMFKANGARDMTLVRGFGAVWEQPLSAILPPQREAEKKPSVRAQLQNKPPQAKGQKKTVPAQER